MNGQLCAMMNGKIVPGLVYCIARMSVSVVASIKIKVRVD